MLFNSVSFLIFFPIVVMLYFIMPKKLKNFWLLVSSYYFYMCWRPEYALLILLSTVTTYLCSIAIDVAKTKKVKQLSLASSIVFNLGILFLFKYYDFFTENLQVFFKGFGIELAAPTFSLLLPVGISFYTFQALGYAIDVYRGDVEREKNFFTYALFVSFFPQLVAGPIERSKNLLPQFKTVHTFDYTQAKLGLIQMGWGFFKKMVIADGVATIVTLVYTTPQKYNGVQLIIATFLFSYQLYCDFSGYSDIAIGCARVLGFKLMRNFNRPYFAKTAQDFWRRWHISLSSWFMDYVYIPLGGSRKGNVRTYVNLIITFLVSGLWHGASWTFVVWGLLNGIYVVLSRFLKPYREKALAKLHITEKNPVYSVISILFIFCLVSFSYIFFRGNTMADSVYIVQHLFTGFTNLMTQGTFTQYLTEILFFEKNGVPLLCCIVLMNFVEAWQGTDGLAEKIGRQFFAIRWTFYYALILLIIFYGNFGKSPFVYFDF